MKHASTPQWIQTCSIAHKSGSIVGVTACHPKATFQLVQRVGK